MRERSLLLPLGLTLGVFFPAGLREVRRRDELLVPWAWGANGAASVVGSVLSIVLALSFGFRAVLLAAAGVYLVAVAALQEAPAAGATRGEGIRADDATPDGQLAARASSPGGTRNRAQLLPG